MFFFLDSVIGAEFQVVRYGFICIYFNNFQLYNIIYNVILVFKIIFARKTTKRLLILRLTLIYLL